MADGLAVAIVIVVVLIIMIWIIVMFVMFHRQSGVFAPYQPTPPPEREHPFYPTGDIIPLSQAEMDQRNARIQASLNQAA